MTWLKVIQVLPDLIKLAHTLAKSRELQTEEQEMKAQELKKHIKEIDEAFKTGDSDKLNAVFKSL